MRQIEPSETNRTHVVVVVAGSAFEAVEYIVVPKCAIGCGYLVRCVTFPSFAVSRKKTIVSDRAARVGGVVAHKAFAVIAV